MIFLLFFTNLKSFSGNEVGNGGDVIICKNSVLLLDYFEAELLKYSLPSYENQKTYLSIANEILETFSKTDKKLSDQYKKRLAEIISETDFLPSVRLTEIHDSKHEFLPKNCQLKQIAIRRKDPLNGKTLLINQDLWQRLSETHKAGLILHEIIYEHFFYLGERNSKKARFMNALLAHLASKGSLRRPYKSILQAKKIPIYR